MKRCCVCGQTKSLDAFSPIQAGKHRRGNCKPCGVNKARAHRAVVRAAFKEGRLTPLTEKRCGRCKVVKPASAFGSNLFVKSGLTPYCRPCASVVEAKDRLTRLAAYLCRSAKARAKKKWLAFDLTPDDINLPLVCPALGVPIVYGSRTNNKSAASIDRIDNAKGYIRGNIIIVCRRANTIKNDATIQELQRIADFYSSLGGIRG